MISEEEKAELLKSAESIELVDHNVQWVDLSRYSARQKTRMRFGGIVGMLRYSGQNLGMFRPWLALAECLHVGGKTTFGLGHMSACFRSPAAIVTTLSNSILMMITNIVNNWALTYIFLQII